jgi:F-type H+-transporting ATPase subunit delta
MPLTEANPDAIAKVYAKSLFELASEAGGREQAETVLGELEDILELARADAKFNEFLATRVIPTDSRDASLVKILEGKASGLTVRFLRLLNRKDRLGHLPPIVTALESLVQEAFGRVEVDLFTAEAIDDATKASFRDTLASKLGKEIILHAYTEPAMLGGVKLRIGDRLVDDSLVTQLSRMRDRLNTDGNSRLRANAQRVLEGEN